MAKHVQRADTEEQRDLLGPESPKIIERAAMVGDVRLGRSAVGDAVTAFIGGLSVSFGVVAYASVAAQIADQRVGHLAGALAFPIGFMIVLIGKSELFTENFLLPVLGVHDGNGTLGELFRLWTLSLVFNLCGVVVFAWLITRPDVLDQRMAAVFVELAEHKIVGSFLGSTIRAVLAGWLMTMLTWLLLATGSTGPRLAIIWAIATLIFLGPFNHAVVSSAEFLIALHLGLGASLGGVVSGTLLPAIIGNLIGGIVFVTILHRFQAHHLMRPHRGWPRERAASWHDERP